MPDTGQNKKRILIVKLGAIGDVVMALPMIEAIRQEHPTAEITWLCGKTVEPVLKLVEGIDRLITIDDALLFKGRIKQRISVIVKCWQTFAFKLFDLVITPYRDKRYKILTLTAKKNTYRSFDGSDRLNSITPGRYHSIEYIKLINGIDDSEIENAVMPDINLDSDPKIENLFKNKDSKYVALVPGGAKNLLNEDSLRNWHIDSYRNLAKLLIDEGYKVIILGAKSDEWINESFAEVDVINLVSKTSIPQLLCVLKKVDLLVSHDTGILHLGKLTNTLSIGLFGPVNPIERVGKNERISVIYEAEKLPCAPCYNGKVFAGCKNNICMKRISVEQVYTKAVSLLRESS